MTIVWIGAGRLATCLGTALQAAGHKTLQVYSRTMDSAAALAARLGCEATDDADAVNTTADVYLFAVSDAALEPLAGRIAPRVGDALCLHTAGSMPMEVFRGRAVRYGVLYPLQTFSREREVDFASVPCFVEASDDAAMTTVKALAASVSGRVEEMSTDRRASLHVAAVFACNFTNHCYALAADLLKRHGVAFDVLLPLVDETARKVHTLPPQKAQTGPAVRYDENVMNRHLQMLGDDKPAAGIYEMMSRSIHRLALRADEE